MKQAIEQEESMQSDYAEFLSTKRIKCGSHGVDCSADEVNPILFPFQRDITAWAVRNLTRAERMTAPLLYAQAE